jgi:hypothetical protein
VGPRAGLDAVEKRIIRILRRESKPRTPIVQPVDDLYYLTALNISGFVTETYREARLKLCNELQDNMISLFHLSLIYFT